MNTERIDQWLRREADADSFFDAGYGEYDDPPSNSVILIGAEKSFAENMPGWLRRAWLYGIGVPEARLFDGNEYIVTVVGREQVAAQWEIWQSMGCERLNWRQQ